MYTIFLFFWWWMQFCRTVSRSSAAFFLSEWRLGLPAPEYLLSFSLEKPRVPLKGTSNFGYLLRVRRTLFCFVLFGFPHTRPGFPDVLMKGRLRLLWLSLPRYGFSGSAEVRRNFVLFWSTEMLVESAGLTGLSPNFLCSDEGQLLRQIFCSPSGDGDTKQKRGKKWAIPDDPARPGG